MRKLFALAASVAALGIAAHAGAAITVYTSQSAYLAAVGTTGTDTFESLSNTSLTASPITRSAGSYGYTASAAAGFFGAGTAADHWLSTNRAVDNINFSAFTGGVFGIGGQFFGSDFNGAFTAVPSITLSATDASGTVSQAILNPTATSFLGFVSTTGLTGFTIASPTQDALNGPFFFATANNLVLGGALNAGPVPEPATWLTMIVGFGLLGASMRRRKPIALA